MRIRRNKWFLILAIIAVIWIVLKIIPQIRVWIVAHRFTIPRTEPALASTAYFLQTNRWLEFDLPKEANQLKLICNPIVTADLLSNKAIQVIFSIEYQMLASQNHTNAQGIYYFQSEPRGFIEGSSGIFVPANYLLAPDLIPLSSTLWIVNLDSPKFKNTRLLRIRLSKADPDVKQVLVRLYGRKPIPERKAAYLWNRLSYSQKQLLARGNVHPIELISPTEKANLLRFHWAGVAPKGIPKKDYKSVTIYIRDDLSGLESFEEWLPPGVLSDANTVAVLPVTNHVRVRFLYGIKDASVPSSILVTNTVTWYPWPIGDPQTNQYVSSGKTFTLPAPTELGLIEIRSSTPTYWQLIECVDHETNMIAPTQPRILTFACPEQKPIEFSIHHDGFNPTLFRADLRALVPPKTNEKPHPTPSVIYQLLDSTGYVINTGTVTITNPVSQYDFIATKAAILKVTDPQSLCFVLPTNVTGVRIKANTSNVLVNAYSRPRELPKKSLFPAEFLPGLLSPEHPTWFTIRPIDSLERRLQRLSQIVAIQPRPPVLNQLIASGLYDWESLTLRESTMPGNLVFCPAKLRDTNRLHSLPFVFVPILTITNSLLIFMSPPQEETIQPTLVLLGTSAYTGSVSVILDEQIIFNKPLPNLPAIIRMPRISPGIHKLAIMGTPSGLRAFVNYVSPDSTGENLELYTLRYCLKVQTNTLKFKYSKASSQPELIVLRIFSPTTASNSPCAFKLSFKGLKYQGYGPFTEVSLPKREITVVSTLNQGLSYIIGQSIYLDEGLSFVFPVNEDVPAGEYEIEIHTVSESPRWLSLSRITLPQSEKISADIETIY